MGVAYLVLTEATYEAQTRILVQQEELAMEQKAAPRTDKLFAATQAEVIRSPLIVRQALASLGISQPALETEDPVTQVLEALHVAPVVQTDVLTLRFRSQDPDRTVAVINAIIAAYQAHLREIESDSQSETLSLLSTRERELRSELNRLQEKHELLRESSPLVGKDRVNANVPRRCWRVDAAVGDGADAQDGSRNQLKVVVAAADRFEAPRQAAKRCLDRRGRWHALPVEHASAYRLRSVKLPLTSSPSHAA
jgi:uncharacterized protein involved in exopolysaccharide biosynthesis